VGINIFTGAAGITSRVTYCSIERYDNFSIALLSSIRRLQSIFHCCYGDVVMVMTVAEQRSRDWLPQQQSSDAINSTTAASDQAMNYPVFIGHLVTPIGIIRFRRDRLVCNSRLILVTATQCRYGASLYNADVINTRAKHCDLIVPHPAT